MKNHKKNYSKIPFESDNLSTHFINSNSESNSDSNFESDSESDLDQYIDLSSQIENNTSHIFQFHLSNDKLILKYIGKSTFAPDIIIKENFGSESNMSLYNCVYTQEELESYNIDENQQNLEYGKDEQNQMDNLVFPLVKLITYEKNNKQTNQEKSDEPIIKISSIVVKINQKIKYETEFNNWDLYWVENIQSEEYVKMVEIDKNINHKNILEKLIELSI